MSDMLSDTPALSQTPADNRPEYSVSEIAHAVKRSIEDSFGHVCVRGELSGVKIAASGHVYLSLKDEKAVLEGVIWKGTAQKLRFRPEDGVEVRATGRLTTYPGRSKYQLVIESLEIAGQGALMALLDKRRRELAAQGLFDAARKKPLPFLPHVIGVITSPTGAVIRDILHRLNDRFPRHVIVWPTPVQGEGAAEKLAAAVRGFNTGGPFPRPDLLILARGGGSIEDLWAFNEEILVQAIANSTIPIISAVGHETDITLADHAADRRAPTPTAAAEMAVPVRADLWADIQEKSLRLIRALARVREQARSVLEKAGNHLMMSPTFFLEPREQMIDDLGLRLPQALLINLRFHKAELARKAALLRSGIMMNRIANAQDSLNQTAQRLRRAYNICMMHKRAMLDDGRRRIDGTQIAGLIREKRLKLDALGHMLQAHDPRAYLKRGYALVHGPDGHPVTSVHQARQAGQVRIAFADGEVDANIENGRAARRKQRGTDAQVKDRAKDQAKDQGLLL